jgi:hypothetical protein
MENEDPMAHLARLLPWLAIRGSVPTFKMFAIQRADQPEIAQAGLW